jgi:UDP-N-acetylglucosamine 2-epimerase (non-hydrolysing)
MRFPSSRFVPASRTQSSVENPTLVHAIGARPNFVKMVPVIRALRAFPDLRQVIVHSGQHYDLKMSDEVLRDLGAPSPDRFLGVGSGTHGDQTGNALIGFERALMEIQPAFVVVGGDVNSTLACSLAASKLGIPIAHVESGLRSWDWTMPEEINRVLTDRLSDVLFTHSPECEPNLLAEGIARERIHYVGNTMIDSLRRLQPRARRLAAWREYGVEDGNYVLVTLHRPSNVDEPGRLASIVDSLVELSRRFAVVFPVHPRTTARLRDLGLAPEGGSRLQLVEPLGYLEFLSLQLGAGAVLTDSGGIQEEASVLGVACYTLRPNTERPVTIERGTNRLLGDDPAAIPSIQLGRREPCLIPLWDGRAGERVARILAARLGLSGDDAPDAPGAVVSNVA